MRKNIIAYINKSIYIAVFMLLLLISCNKNIKLDKKIIDWESEQRYNVYKMAINAP